MIDEDEVDAIEARLAKRSWFTRGRLLGIALGVPLVALAYVLAGDGSRVLGAKASVPACDVDPARVRSTCSLALRERLGVTGVPTLDDEGDPLSLDGCSSSYRARYAIGDRRGEALCTFDGRTGSARIDLY